MFSGLDFDAENNSTSGTGVVFIIGCINFDAFRQVIQTVHRNYRPQVEV